MQSEHLEKSRFHAYRHNLPIIAVIGTDASWAQIAREQVNIFGTALGTELVRTEIEKIFPHIATRGIKSVSFRKGEDNEKIVSAMRIGCVLSGGQAAGGHNVIVGLYDYIKRKHKNSQLFGFLGGPKGIFTGKYAEINQ